MNRKVAWLAGLAVSMAIVACAHNPRYMGVDVGQRDFMVDISPSGYVTIIGYNGRDRDVQIPSQLYRMPVVGIGDGAFAGSPMSRITSVYIPSSVTFIGAGAFANNRLQNVTVPNSVTFIGDRAFANNRLESVTISNNVTRIGTRVFENNHLENIAIPAAVTYIGDRAFARNRFENKPYMPNVIWIRDSAFSRNRNLVGFCTGGEESNVIVITGARPDPSGTYTMQVGTFEEISDAHDTFGELMSVGFRPLVERSDSMYLVFIPNVRGSAVTEVAQQLAFAGFRTSHIRREN